MSWAGLLDLLDTAGPHALIARTRAFERRMPGPSDGRLGRTHDDATAMLVRFTCEKDAGALVQIGRTFGDVRMVSVPDAPEDEVAFVTPCMPEYLLTEKFDSFKGMRLVRALRIYMH